MHVLMKMNVPFLMEQCVQTIQIRIVLILDRFINVVVIMVMHQMVIEI